MAPAALTLQEEQYHIVTRLRLCRFQEPTHGLTGLSFQRMQLTDGGTALDTYDESPSNSHICMQAVTRQIMAIGQELTYARERVALLDDAPKQNGSIAPQRVSPSLDKLHSRCREQLT